MHKGRKYLRPDEALRSAAAAPAGGRGDPEADDLIAACKRLIALDLERIEDEIGNSDQPLPPELASKVAKYMTALALVEKRIGTQEGAETLQDLLEECAGIPEMQDMVKRLQGRS